MRREGGQEGGKRGHRQVKIGQMVPRPLSQRRQFPLLTTLFRAKMATHLVLGQHAKEGRQLGAAVRIEAGEQFPVIGDQGVPNPGGNFIDQVRIGGAVSEQNFDGLDQRRMALLVEFFPGGYVTAETSIHELAITVRSTAFAAGNSRFFPGGSGSVFPGGSVGGIGFGFASFCHGKTPGNLGLWASFIERANAWGGASFDTHHTLKYGPRSTRLNSKSRLRVLLEDILPDSPIVAHPIKDVNNPHWRIFPIAFATGVFVAMVRPA